MSLFKARDWWSTTCGVDEEFDKGCLCVGNIDNNSDGSVKIIVGSYSGLLRIFKPQPVKLENGSYSNFRPDELLLEAQLKSPIIQVQTGYLVSATNLVHLAVLHPYKLCVYLVAVTPGAVEHGTSYSLSLTYEHNLQRHAFSMILGPFGEVKGKDFVCVQSLDGTVNIYEQESFAFSRALTHTIVPGPITYVPRTDSFVVVSGYCAESYRFQVLAVATDQASENGNENIKGKKLTTDWSYNIGEWAKDVITVPERNQNPSIILILGERTLFGLNTNGTLRFAKKFNFTPSCFMAHNEGTDGSLIILIATLNQTLLVFQEVCLKWAAQLPFRPVCLRRATLMDVKGLLVSLSSEGNLACCYLGTEPSLFVSPMTDTKEINFEEAEKEMQELKKLIKSSNQNLLGTHNLGNEISVSISMPYQVDAVISNGKDDSDKSFGPVPTVTVKVQLKCITVVHDVRLMIHVDPPLKVSQNVFTFGSVVDSTQAIIKVSLNSSYVPSSLSFIAHAVYTSSQGAPRIFESSAILPLSLIGKACPPSKTAEYRITIDVNKKIISTGDLFSDLSADNSCFSGGAMGVEYYCGPVVTIMPSKSSQKYRLQSDDFSSLYIVTSELIRRLKYKYRKDTEEKLKCQYSTALPLQEYFNVIQDHFEKRQILNEMETLLSQRSEQFRVVQKRLLTKMKDKTPTPLNNLDTLLEATHRHILSLTDSMEKHTVALESSTCSLNAATQLVLLLLKMSVEIKDDEYAFIYACFSPSVDFDAVQGWEEKMNVTLTYLLQHCLGREESQNYMPDTILEMPKDISKLKKHIALVLDSVIKNGTVKVAGSYIDENDEYNNEAEMGEGEMEDDLMIPIGSKFAGTESTKNNALDSLSPRDDSLSDTPADEDDTPRYINEDDYDNDADLDDYPDNTDELII